MGHSPGENAGDVEEVLANPPDTSETNPMGELIELGTFFLPEDDEKAIASVWDDALTIVLQVAGESTELPTPERTLALYRPVANSHLQGVMKRLRGAQPKIRIQRSVFLAEFRKACESDRSLCRRA